MQIAIDSLDFCVNLSIAIGEWNFIRICEQNQNIHPHKFHHSRVQFMAEKVLLNVKGFLYCIESGMNCLFNIYYYTMLMLEKLQKATKNEKSISSLRIPDWFLENVYEKVWHQCINCRNYNT